MNFLTRWLLIVFTGLSRAAATFFKQMNLDDIEKHQSWRKMKLGDVLEFPTSPWPAVFLIIRVPGGWVVNNAFVPELDHYNYEELPDSGDQRKLEPITKFDGNY